MVKDKQFNFRGRIYSVTGCSKEDIPSHIERVLSYWQSTSTDIDRQIKLLEEAIETDTAFKLIDDTGASKAGIYYKQRDALSGDSHYMFFDDKRMLAMLCFYLRMVACLEWLYFLPHSKDFIPFKFLVQEDSIRNFYSFNTPLKVSLSSRKARIFYEDHFIKYGITEV